MQTFTLIRTVPVRVIVIKHFITVMKGMCISSYVHMINIELAFTDNDINNDIYIIFISINTMQQVCTGCDFVVVKRF